jgi:flagellar export protein FliJ
VKKFRFPLDRVLAWRHTLVRLEQVKLEGMMEELRRLEGQAAALQGERESAQRAVIQSRSSLGLELSAFDTFRQSSATRSKALDQEGCACLERIRVQREVISRKECDVRILEKLREDRWRAWSLEENREVDRQAEEAFLGRWKR